MATKSMFAATTRVAAPRTTRKESAAAQALRERQAAERKALRAKEEKAAKAAHAEAVKDYVFNLEHLTYEAGLVIADALKARASSWKILTQAEADAYDAKRKAKKLDPKGKYHGGLAQNAHKAGWTDAQIRAEYNKRLKIAEMVVDELAGIDAVVAAR